jgi:hypothetical protein
VTYGLEVIVLHLLAYSCAIKYQEAHLPASEGLYIQNKEAKDLEQTTLLSPIGN